MSEFITKCPKCSQQIMGDTSCVGARVGCPLCLQEIILPSPFEPNPASASHQPGVTGKGRSISPAIAVVSSLFVICLAAGMVLILRKSSSTPPPQAPTANAAAGQAPVVSFHYSDNGIPFGGTAGVVPASGWNHSKSVSGAGLLDHSGAATTVAYSLITKLEWGAWSIASSLPARDADGAYNRVMMWEYDNSGSDYDNPETLSLRGIPYGSYDLYVYFSSDEAGRAGTITLGAATYDFATVGLAAISGDNALLIPTTDTTGVNPTADYAVFSALTGDAQTVTVNIRKGGGISAFQIVATSPKPNHH
jgi:guanyl-specific ribonuclease Sa